MSDASGTVRMGVTREGSRVTVAAQGAGGERVTLGLNASAAGALCANLQAALTSDDEFESDFSVRADLEVSR